MIFSLLLRALPASALALALLWHWGMVDAPAWRVVTTVALATSAGLLAATWRLSWVLRKLSRDLRTRSLIPDKVLKQQGLIPLEQLPDYMWYPDDARIKGIDTLADELVILQKALWEGIYEARMGKDRFRVILDNTQQSVILIDRSRNVVLLNRMASLSFPLLREGEPFHRVFADPELIEAVSSLLTEYDANVPAAMHFARREMADKRIFDITVSAIPWHTPSILMVLHEQTEAENTRRMREQFVANAAHELKTPLATLQLAVETLKPSLPEAKVWQRFFPSIERGTQRLHELVRDMMDLSRYESRSASRSASEAQSSSVDPVLDAVLADLESWRGSRTIERIVDAEESPLEKNDLRVLLHNLLGNAMRHSADEARIEIGSTLVEDTHGKPRWRLQVANNGVRIPETEMERVFERFYRVDDGRNRDDGGSGLGLSIVRHLVLAYGGDVAMTRWLENGVVVTVAIPLTPPKVEKAKTLF